MTKKLEKNTMHEDHREEDRKTAVSETLEESMDQHDVLYRKLAAEGVSDEPRGPLRS